MRVTQFKAAFFDRQAIAGKVDAAIRRTLSKFGAFVRRRARNSIRKRKDVSQPGSPPSSHEGSLKRLIMFAYEPANGNVVIGPAAFRDGTAPPLLEYGGAATKKRKDGSTRRMQYRARPFIHPAAEAELPTFAESLRGMVK